MSAAAGPAWEESAVEKGLDAGKAGWLYSGPGREGPQGKLKVWRQDPATGACEEKEVEAGVAELGTYQRVAREALGGGGTRVQSKDFPHAPSKAQEEAMALPDLPLGAAPAA